MGGIISFLTLSVIECAGCAACQCLAYVFNATLSQVCSNSLVITLFECNQSYIMTYVRPLA